MNQPRFSDSVTNRSVVSVVALVVGVIAVIALMFYFVQDPWVILVLAGALVVGIVLVINLPKQGASRMALVTMAILMLLNVINYSPVSRIPGGTHLADLRAPLVVISVFLLITRSKALTGRIIGANLDVFAFVLWAIASGALSSFSSSDGIFYALWLGLSLLLLLFLIGSYQDIPRLVFDVITVFILVYIIPAVTALFNLNDIYAGTRLFGILDVRQLNAWSGTIVIVSLVLLRHVGSVAKRENLFTNPYISALLIILSFISVVLSGTRTAAVAIAGFFAVYFLLSLVSSSFRKLYILRITAVGMLGLVTVAYLITPQLVNRYASFLNYFSSDSAPSLDYSDGLRLQIWQANFDVFSANPIAGVGLTNAASAVVLPSLEGNWSPHSTYVEIISETGIVGVVFFLIITIRSVALLIRNHFGKGSSGMGLYIILLAIPVLVISSLESNLTPGQALFFPFWLAILLPRSGNMSIQAVEPDAASLPEPLSRPRAGSH